MRWVRFGRHAIAAAAVARGDELRSETQDSLDWLLAVATLAVAIASSVGYQLLRAGRLVDRAGRP